LVLALLFGFFFPTQPTAFADQQKTTPLEELTGTLTIGSKSDTETRVLGEIMAQLIEARTSIKVDRKLGLGGTLIVFNALKEGQLDLVPEYTGTAWSAILKRTDDVHDALKAYVLVSKAFQARWQLTWLAPFGFSNSYGLAMMSERAEELGIKDISQLAQHSGTMKAGFSPEFIERPDCLPGLEQDYDLHFGDVRNMEHGLVYQALLSGEVDVVDVYTTDGKLIRYPFTVLEDNKKFFPPYDAAPVIRAETLTRFPGLRGLLDELGFTMTAEEMREVNAEAEESGGVLAPIAKRFLEEHGLIGPKRTGDTEAIVPEAGGGPGSESKFSQFLHARLIATPPLLAQHLWLTFSSVVLAILVALPLGVLIVRRRYLVTPTMGLAGVIQTIPSLALLAFMIPIPGLGLSTRSAILALFLYAILPILRNTYAGLLAVDPELMEAARGMGLTYKQILFRVRLPLAGRAIMTGIRTATVISIGVATLAAFIGAGGLGEPIITGLNMNDNWLILSGAIPAAVLAIVADYGLGWVEHVLTPRGLRMQERSV